MGLGAIRPTSLLSGGAIRPTSLPSGGAIRPTSRNGDRYSLCQKGGLETVPVPVSSQKNRSPTCLPGADCRRPSPTSFRERTGRSMDHAFRHRGAMVRGNDRRRTALRIPKSTIPTRSLRCLERILKVFNKKPSGISWEELRRHTAGPKRIQTAFITARPALDSLSARLPIAV